MKQKIYIFGLVTTLVIATGVFLKVNHLAGAAVLLAFGIAVLVLLFLPVALANHYKSGTKEDLPLYVVTWLTCFIVFTAMLFKILHWPFAGYFLIIALPFPYVVFLPVFLSVTSRNKNFNIYDTVAVLLLLAVVSVSSLMLALNVSRERIDDSYDLAHGYNRLEMVLDGLPGIRNNVPGPGSSSINLKIDELVKVVDEYQRLIFSSENITKEQWNTDPEVLLRPEAPARAAIALKIANEAYPGEKLETGIKSLIQEFEKTPGYEELAKTAPAIFNYKEPVDKESHWAGGIFIDNNLSWALIYLDGLKVNLKLIKASVNKS